jgi:hypothetical protein
LECLTFVLERVGTICSMLNERPLSLPRGCKWPPTAMSQFPI